MIQVRKNRVVQKMLVTRRGELKTDQIKLPPNALRVTGVLVTSQHLQVAPDGGNGQPVLPRYYFGASNLTAPTPAMVGALPSNTFDGMAPINAQANAGAGQYFYYAHPVWLTDPIFAYGGFQGGFLNMGPMDIATPEGVMAFVVWRSTNANLGDTSLQIIH